MAKKVFAVYLAKEDVPNSEAYATLEQPASPWELWDAMEKVRLKDGEALYMEIDDYYAFEYLAPHLEELDISLNELNDLAARLATLDEVQGIAFEGLFSMEVQKKVNTKQAERKLRLLMNANFAYGDYHLVLDYIRHKGEPDRTREEMKKDIQVFLRECRKLYKKA